nr:hypothetical protein C4D60_Mb11t18320 [Ipomoea batatas]
MVHRKNLESSEITRLHHRVQEGPCPVGAPNHKDRPGSHVLSQVVYSSPLFLLIHPHQGRQEHHIVLLQVARDAHDVRRVEEHAAGETRIRPDQPRRHGVRRGINVVVVEIRGRKRERLWRGSGREPRILEKWDSRRPSASPQSLMRLDLISWILEQSLETSMGFGGMHVWTSSVNSMFTSLEGFRSSNLEISSYNSQIFCTTFWLFLQPMLTDTMRLIYYGSDEASTGHSWERNVAGQACRGDLAAANLDRHMLLLAIDVVAASPGEPESPAKRR